MTTYVNESFLKNGEIILPPLSRSQFYHWLKKNNSQFKGCYLIAINRDPKLLAQNQLSYIDAVEVALCFGWIDSTNRKLNNICYRRFSPRRKNSHWTELNKERCRRLITLRQMAPEGKKVLPDLNQKYQPPEIIIKELKKNKEAYHFFIQTPNLYQRVRLDNLFFLYQRREFDNYQKSLKRLIQYCQQKKLFGNFNDYGRLSNN